MDFTVTTADGPPQQHRGNAHYEVGADAVLVVYAEDGKRSQYSPAYWRVVEDQPAPGQNRPIPRNLRR